MAASASHDDVMKLFVFVFVLTVVCKFVAGSFAQFMAQRWFLVQTQSMVSSRSYCIFLCKSALSVLKDKQRQSFIVVFGLLMVFFTKIANDWEVKLLLNCDNKENAKYLEAFIKRMKSKKFIKTI